MAARTRTTPALDLEKYRLRRFVDRLIEMGEVEVHSEQVALTERAVYDRTKAAMGFFGFPIAVHFLR